MVDLNPPSSLIIRLQPTLEISKGNRKHRTRCRRGASINRMNLAVDEVHGTPHPGRGDFRSALKGKSNSLASEPSDDSRITSMNWLGTRAATEYSVVMHQIGQHIPAPNKVLQI
jgi:hypothetical protein